MESGEKELVQEGDSGFWYDNQTGLYVNRAQSIPEKFVFLGHSMANSLDLRVFDAAEVVPNGRLEDLITAAIKLRNPNDRSYMCCFVMFGITDLLDVKQAEGYKEVVLRESSDSLLLSKLDWAVRTLHDNRFLPVFCTFPPISFAKHNKFLLSSELTLRLEFESEYNKMQAKLNAMVSRINNHVEEINCRSGVITCHFASKIYSSDKGKIVFNDVLLKDGLHLSPQGSTLFNIELAQTLRKVKQGKRSPVWLKSSIGDRQNPPIESQNAAKRGNFDNSITVPKPQSASNYSQPTHMNEIKHKAPVSEESSYEQKAKKEVVNLPLNSRNSQGASIPSNKYQGSILSNRDNEASQHTNVANSNLAKSRSWQNVSDHHRPAEKRSRWDTPSTDHMVKAQQPIITDYALKTQVNTHTSRADVMAPNTATLHRSTLSPPPKPSMNKQNLSQQRYGPNTRNVDDFHRNISSGVASYHHAPLARDSYNARRADDFPLNIGQGPPYAEHPPEFMYGHDMRRSHYRPDDLYLTRNQRW